MCDDGIELSREREKEAKGRRGEAEYREDDVCVCTGNTYSRKVGVGDYC